jgi:hypothetical protein
MISKFSKLLFHVVTMIKTEATEERDKSFSRVVYLFDSRLTSIGRYGLLLGSVQQNSQRCDGMQFVGFVVDVTYASIFFMSSFNE